MSSKTLSFKTLFGLILCNLVWSIHPTLGKFVLEDFGPAHVAWLRYSSALLAFFFVTIWLRLGIPFIKLSGTPSKQEPKFRPWILAALLGFLSFCYSPLMQMTGLARSRATDNALIIAMEPIATCFLAFIVLGEALSARVWIAFILALIGFVMLSGLSAKSLLGRWDGPVIGNLIMALSLLGEASYSVIARKLMTRSKPLAVFGTALIFGVLFLTIATVALEGWPDLGRLTLKSSLAILVMGPVGTALAYVYWMMALLEAPIASLAITLFIQPVMGAVFGYAFLGEHLSALQWVGGALILLSVLAQSARPKA